MPSLQIRDLPRDVYEALALRARTENRSLAQQAVAELRRMPEIEAGERRRSLAASLRERLEREGSRTLSAAPEDLIREDRDR
jgi:plasmid stability protein